MLDFKIAELPFNQNQWFLHDTGRVDHQHPISYRLVLLHSIFQFASSNHSPEEIHNNDINIREEIFTHLQTARNIIQTPDPNTHFFLDRLFGIYKFIADNDIGVILVDRSIDRNHQNLHGVFPLVFYPNNYGHLPTHLRVAAFTNSFNEVFGNFGINKNYFQIILPYLVQNRPWDRDLQLELASKFDPLSSEE